MTMTKNDEEDDGPSLRKPNGRPPSPPLIGYNDNENKIRYKRTRLAHKMGGITDLGRTETEKASARPMR